jgi:hypothetical protein
VSTTVRSDDVNILQPSKRPGKSDDNTVSEDVENIDETLYGNVRPDNVTTKYSVTELHNVINEKHTNDGFLKEYEVSDLFTKYITCTLKCQEKLEDTKGVIRRCKIKKGR